MYELVNTSLPNGLIPGTHGFATVAMTKGTPDTLRTRLEAYCAYSHRTGAHDATYFNENPVNWFHVILPQGEHVVGRVAPAEFDYTGRTNRLAHLLVFPKSEMPAVGGASILQAEYNRFVEPWSGEARWLDVDKLTPDRLRLDIPTASNYAPAWRAMFGEATGLDIAKGFARLLTKNISSGGRTIYFKTSARHNADGTKLLALFADLIDLLPATERQKVAFATYPVSLPQGVICHLRGVYDRDRIFDAAAVTQPWVDCENGVVHNASLLPPEETRKAITSVKSIPSPEIRSPLPSRAVETKSHSLQNLTHPGNDGTKTLFRWIVAVALLMVISLIGWALWICFDHRQKTHDSGTEKTSQAESVNDTDPLLPMQDKGPKAKTPGGAGSQDMKAEAQAAKAKAQGQKMEAGAEAAKKNEQNQRAEKSAGTESERAKNDALDQVRREAARKGAVAFESAGESKLLEGGMQAKYRDKEKEMTNGTLRVFFYDKNGILTNAHAGFVPPKNKTIRNASWSLEPKPQKLADETSGMFLIWLDVKANKVYWDWTPHDRKIDRTWEKWFAETNEIDLVEVCFGKTLEVRDTWKKIVGGAFSIAIEIEDGKGKYQMPFECNLDPFSPHKCLSVNDVINFVRGKEKGKKDLDLKGLEDRIIELKAQRERVQTANKNYEELRKELESINKSLDQLRKTAKKQTLNGDTEKSKKKESADVKKEIDKIPDELKGEQSRFGIVLRSDNHEIKGWKELMTKIDGVIERKEKELKGKKQANSDNDDKIRETIRTYKFRIVKVGGNAK